MASSIDTRLPIGDILDQQTDRYADREALVHTATGDRFHLSAVSTPRSSASARGLMSVGIQKGQHVGIWATNYTEWVLTQFATAKIGAVLVNVNPAYRTHELAYLLEQSQLTALVLIGRFRTSDYVAMVNELIPELLETTPGQLNSGNFPHLRHLIFIPPHDDPRRCNPRRHVALERPAYARRAGEPCRSSGPPGRVRPRRPHQHPVHLRHHRQPQGRDPHPPQHPLQCPPCRRLHGDGRARPASASPCPSTTASAALWAP